MNNSVNTSPLDFIFGGFLTAEAFQSAAQMENNVKSNTSKISMKQKHNDRVKDSSRLGLKALKG